MKRLASIRFLFLFVLFIGLFTLVVRNVTDPDVWWHLKTGQLILETHAIPHADPFSFTRAGHPWIAHEWLSGVFIYQLWRIAGRAGLIVSFAVIVCAALLILFLRCESNACIAGVLVLCAAFATRPLWGPRPQMISFLLSSLWLLILERSERHPALLWWTLPITFLWVNLHAGFALGLVFSSLFLAGRWLENKFSRPENGMSGQPFTSRNDSSRVGFSALILALDLLIVPLNPSGARLLFYPLDTLRSSGMQNYIAEWASPNFHHPEYWPFLLLILSTFAVAAFSPSQVRVRDLLLIVVTLFAGLRSIRLIPAYVLIAVPIIAKAVNDSLRNVSSAYSAQSSLCRKTPSTIRGVLHATILAFMVTFGFLQVRRVIHRQPLVEAQTFPERAVLYLQSHPPPGPIFNSYDWGGYLVWKLYPSTPVFIDGRADLYGNALLQQFADTYQLKGDWSSTLLRWKIQTVLIARTSALASGLRESSDWSVAYEDEEAVVMIKARP